MTKPSKQTYYARDIETYGKVLTLRGFTDEDTRKSLIESFLDSLPDVPDDVDE